jgi:arginase
LGVDVLDAGNINGPANPWGALVDGYRNAPEAIAWIRAIRDAHAEALELGRLPILLGGDHSLAIGSISALAAHCKAKQQPLYVLWLDAHADFNTSALSPTGNLHGMPVATLCGMGHPSLVSLSGFVPALPPAHVRQIGIRSVDPGERALARAQGLPIYDMRFIDEHGMREAVSRALSDIPKNAHLHVSFDADFLDPSFAPGVGTPVQGGPTYREAQLCMEMVADSGLLGSLDIMEVNPAMDERNATAKVAVELAESLFGKSTLAR